MKTDPSKPVLEFRSVGFAAEGAYETDIVEASFRIQPGELLLLYVDTTQDRTPVADLAQGLIAPGTGEVLFQGEDWMKVGPDDSSTLRSRIGRVFESGGWVSNLDLDENVTLAQRYHYDRPDEDVLEEALRIAREVGLDDIPKARPALVNRQILRRAQWVRALIGTPALLILDHPCRELSRSEAGRLARSLEQRRAGGLAALWITQDEGEESALGLKPTLKLRLQDSKMLPA